MKKIRKKARSVDMVLCAQFAALSAVLSQIAVPIGPVPVTLTFLAVFLAGGVLGARYGAVSQAVFVALGAMGAPVFAQFKGGPSHLVGPTGGFILGYVVCAWVVGFAAGRWGRSPKVLIPAMIAGVIATYAPGTLWFMHVTNNSLEAALGACVLPFLPGDAAKIALCAALIPTLYAALRKRAAQGGAPK